MDREARLDLPITRYLPLSQFLSLVQERKLAVPKASLLNDKWELVAGMKALTHKALRAGLAALEAPAAIDPHALDRFDFTSQNWAREWIYVSCWHRSAVESMAMWHVYSKGEPGVAIQTTPRKLWGAFKSQRDPFYGCMGRVRYEGDEFIATGLLSTDDHLDIGYGESIGSAGKHGAILATAVAAMMYKRAPYSHEQEYRLVVLSRHAVMVDDLPPDNDLPIHELFVDPVASFIDRIILQPDLPNWIESVVRKALPTQELRDKMARSEMTAPQGHINTLERLGRTSPVYHTIYDKKLEWATTLEGRPLK